MASPSTWNARRRKRQRRARRALALGLLGVVGAAAAGITMHLTGHSGPGRVVSAADAAHLSRSPASARPTASATPGVPESGTGHFLRATGGTGVVGSGGTLLRYSVDVEAGIGQDPQAFARQVDAILDNTRLGWASTGKWSFQRVSRGPVDFTVHLASPHSTDVLCGRYGLDTGGWVNCSGGKDVVINLKRWLLLSPSYQGKPDLYHALAVNHEVGHRLGHHHVGCPGPGKPAPVMMQQIKGLHGCVINSWPFDGHGNYLTGPPTS
jgi:hypothetical protein